MTQETRTELETFPAPWGKDVKLEDIRFEGGMRFLRIRIQEGKRFTTLDLDEDTARHLQGAVARWLEAE